MRTWGRHSKTVYNSLDPRLQTWCDRLLHEVADVSLISGYRTREEQTTLFENNLSKLRYLKVKQIIKSLIGQVPICVPIPSPS